VAEDSTPLFVTKTMADLKATETRLENLERSIQKLLTLQTKTEEERTGGKVEDKKGPDYGKDESPEKKDNQGEEKEKNVTRKYYLKLSPSLFEHSVANMLATLGYKSVASS
jgi:hypothetical protein